MNNIEQILAEARNNEISDIFFCVGKTPAFRHGGRIARDSSLPPISDAELRTFRDSVLNADQREVYRANGNADASYCQPGGGRFRVNFLETLGGAMAVIRPVATGGGLLLEQLSLPDSLRQICENPRGIILVTGSTGSGKSTTLGAMINHLNTKFAKHILTIEDPIEFVHEDKKSLVTQRELSADVTSYADALRSALRENPDVIVLGEVRDPETMQVAINAALTGHLVIGTLHSSDTVSAIERVVNLFPDSVREQAAMDLGAALVAVVSQRLIPLADKSGGRVPAIELLQGTPAIKKAIGERNFRGVDDLLRENTSRTMQTFNRAVFELLQSGRIELEDALKAVDSPDEFMLQVKGMESGNDAFRNAYGSGADSDAIDMRQLLRAAVKSKASDLILSAGAKPVLRVNGELCPFDLPVLGAKDTQRLLYSILTPMQKIEFETNRELDMALSVKFSEAEGAEKSYRFRLNGFFQRGSVGAVARIIPSTIPSPETLNLPAVMIKLTDKAQGLILVTGPTGSGKSTTQAALLDNINRNRAVHIITIEDPIEYIHFNKKSVVEQRELHADTMSFATSLKYALRQDPDVILVGEMRDVETVSAVLTAAETGHLVFATLHTNSAPQTIDRIIDSFPSGQQNQIRQQLSGVLLGVISQRLLEKVDGSGRVGAFEIMVGTPPVQSLIREGKTHQLQSHIETGFRDGMITLERSLEELYAAGLVRRSEVDSLRRDISAVKAF